MADHTRRVCDNLRRLLGIRQSEDGVKVDAKPSIRQTKAVMSRMQASVDTLHRPLEQGKVIYGIDVKVQPMLSIRAGVNTGVGDNAYTRAKLLTTLQHSVCQHHQAGILLIDQDHISPTCGSVQHSLAEDIVRGMILVHLFVPSSQIAPTTPAGAISAYCRVWKPGAGMTKEAAQPVDPADLADRKKYGHGGSAIRAPQRGSSRKRRLDTKRVRDMTFDERLISQGLGNLYGYSPGRYPHAARIELVVLQRMILYDLQRQRVAATAEIARSYEAMAAVRNFDFMTERHRLAHENDERDLFLITTDDPSSYHLMNDHLMLPKRFDHRYFDEDISPGHMGLCGGLALIAPMLLMVLHNDTPTTLATASAATIIFALGLAWFGEDLDGKDVLASVAAYAAVMVVFIGTSS
ncbi:hypothetical protein BO86DRAFT_404481 [Aspergillus japonicus CBS 114.51]|uniref:DUF6594 domain-containing protein n=1 Tax=Aspergillus japonicus CBS 114.51 TaxID=1448312 RepID=A0A8T8WM44_ASPJA|nr:hypothetical protein BO86DRAFT_404481 [Aspergillus japonicus CBS 114.51]RAH76620.1 hypothetical protein BO86DRAFT_404481 [Aspergillus japonicus CBS 114.51]